METVESFFSTPYAYVIIIFVVVVIIYIPFMLRYMKKQKMEEEKWLSEHKDVSKIYISGAMDYVQLTVKDVDGEAAHSFQKGTKRGFYLEEGKHNVLISATWTRPGVMYKSVTTTTDDITIQIEIEKNKEYRIIYNKKIKQFEITEEK